MAQSQPYPSVIETIGETPVIELSRLTRDLDGRILAKLEDFNPGFSKKDRIARQIIEDAEAQGLLAPGGIVVELTSGNTGTGLAIVCGIKGYRFVAVMSRGNSMERARMMSALGAEVVLVDQLPASIPGQVSGGDLALVEAVAQRITAERGAFRADQFRQPGNFRAHYLHTGPEYLRQSGGRIGAFCDFAGRAARSPGAPRPSKNTIPPFSASWSSRMARRCWPASRLSTPTIGFRAAGMPCPICHCSGPSMWTAI